MLRLAANIDVLFKDLPVQERFAAARAAGFTRIEMRSPYDMSIRDLDRALTRHHLELALISTPAGDWAAGERGFMGVPRRIADFRQGFEKAMEYAVALDVETIHLMAGTTQGARAHKMLTRNLAWAAYQAPERSLTLGPMNSADGPSYAIEGFDQALELMDWIGAPNLGLCFDVHFAHQTNDGVMGSWEKYRGRTRHVDMTRGMTGKTGDVRALLTALTHDDYEGVVSVQAVPQTAT